MNIKLLSLVVPAYKQEKTITRDIKALDKALSAFPFKHELIVVVDGFVDNTYEILQNIKPKTKNLHFPQQLLCFRFYISCPTVLYLCLENL